MVRHLFRAVLLKATSAFAGVALSYIVARSMTELDAGTFFYSLSLLIATTTLAMLGLDASVMRELSSRKVSSLSGDASYLATLSRSVGLASSILITLILGTYFFLVHYLPLGKGVVNVPLLFATILLPFFSRLCVNAEILRGCGFHNAQVLYVGFAVPSIYTVFALAARIASWDLGTNQWLIIYGSIIVMVATASELHVKKITVTKNTRVVSAKQLVSALGLSLPLLFVSGSQSLIQVIPTSLAGSVLGAAEAAHFHVAYRIALLISFTLASVNVVFAPALARAYHGGDARTAIDMVRISSALGLIFGLPVFAFCVFFSGELLSVFGAQYRVAQSLLVTLAVSQFVNASTGCVFVFLVMTRKQTSVSYINLASVLLLSALGYLVLDVYGLLGLAWVVNCVIIFSNVAALIVIKRDSGVWITPLFDLKRIFEMRKLLAR